MRRLAVLPGMAAVELVSSRTDRMCAGVPIPPAAVTEAVDVASFLAAVEQTGNPR